MTYPRMASAVIRRRIVRDFQTQLYRTCGVRSAVLIAYGKEDGMPQVALYVISYDFNIQILIGIC
jgi:hypothetical protein